MCGRVLQARVRNDQARSGSIRRREDAAADISVGLYKVAPDVGAAALVKQTGQRLRQAVEAMLLTAPDLKLSPDRFAIDMMLSAMSGAMRSALQAGASLAMFRKVREHLVLLCQSYMAAATYKDHHNFSPHRVGIHI
jgi:hypothetical protein